MCLGGEANKSVEDAVQTPEIDGATVEVASAKSSAAACMYSPVRAVPVHLSHLRRCTWGTLPACFTALRFIVWIASSTPGPERPTVPEAPVAPVPYAPSGVSPTKGSRSATVVRRVPADDGRAMKGRRVWLLDVRGQRRGYVRVSPAVTRVTITGSAPSTWFNVTDSAWNVIGTGPESARLNPIENLWWLSGHSR
jgi:hypothetical protein